MFYIASYQTAADTAEDYYPQDNIARATRVWEELMPLYQYRCLDCGAVFEKMMTVISCFIVFCPQCGGKAVIVIYPVPHIWKEGEKP